MVHINLKSGTIEWNIPKKQTARLVQVSSYLAPLALICFLIVLSINSFVLYHDNGLGLAYNDARSHLDIGRRVVEGLKPGLAQLGSVWLPLPHMLMVPTIWNDFMWHSGLSGAVQSMISFVATGLIIYYYLKKIGVGVVGRTVGVLLFALNINILYLQSTAMTELLLLATMTAGAYEFMMWAKEDKLLNLMKAAAWIMLSTLIRYDGWFLLAMVAGILGVLTWQRKGWRSVEGVFLFFCTLGGLGIVLWIVWNWMIFKDPLYFVLGPYSAHAQQQQLASAGVLATKGDIGLSLKIYWYAMMYNTYAFTVLAGVIGAIVLWFDKKIHLSIKLASTALFAPFAFNVLALYLGHSVLFVQGLSGNSLFNVRYGIMMMPSIAIFVGYLVGKLKALRVVLIGLLVFTLYFAFANNDAVTIDDARVGSSQKNVSEVSGWLSENTKGKEGFILISAASHDAIIFSSGLPMKRFIHEGTGKYWESATTSPDRWARWIVMRTHDENDQTFAAVEKSGQLGKYTLVNAYPFADIYELKSEYLGNLNTQPILGKQR